MKLKTLAVAATVLTATVIGILPAQAQTAASGIAAKDGCLAPDTYARGKLRWFLGLNPADDLLTAWCRVQTLPGNVRFNVQFPFTNVHQSWDTSFATPLPASRIVEIVQSIIPTDDSNRVSETGVSFADVLANAVQLEASKAPDGTILGFAETHPAAKQIVLWEPLGLRVKPVVVAGQEFTLSVYLRPNLGLLSMALAGHATDVKVKGWTDRFQSGNFLKTACSEYFPACSDLPEVAVMHMPLLVDMVKLEAEGDNMTAAAIAIGQEIYARNAYLTPVDPMKAFDRANGSGTFTIHDEESEVEFAATGNGGTKRISITYRVLDGQGSMRRELARIADEYRAGTDKKKKSLPPVPDSFGKL